MDRFEAVIQKFFKCFQLIYIPVWIDLKRPNYANARLDSEIYIPVWIDLKKNQ